MKALITILILMFAFAIPVNAQEIIGCEHHIQPGDLDWCRLCGPCDVGEGDCDSDSECAEGLVCPEVSGVDICMYPENIIQCEPGTNINIRVISEIEIGVTCK